MADLPPPPDGYRPAIRFEYPILPLQIASFAVLAASAFVYGAIPRPDAPLSYLFSRPVGEVLILLVAMVVTVVVHELAHGFAYRLLGYRVSFGIAPHLGAAYAAAFGQWQTRDHNILAALAPLILLTPVGMFLLRLDAPALTIFGFGMLLMNTSGAVGDVYLSAYLLRKPPATLTYDVDVKTSLVYEPEQS